MTSTTRRALVGAAMATVLPSAPWAADRTARVAILTVADDGWHAGVVAELQKQGFVQGRNLQVDVRIAPADAMPAVAKDLVAQKPDVVVAVSDWAVHALRATGAPVPIVASPMGADPVTAGVARSWANPGGNVTGVSILATQLDIKRLSLLREAMPSLRRVAVLSNHRQGVERRLPPLRAAATSAGLDLAEIWVENSPGDIPQAFETVRSAQVEA